LAARANEINFSKVLTLNFNKNLNFECLSIINNLIKLFIERLLMRMLKILFFIEKENGKKFFLYPYFIKLLIFGIVFNGENLTAGSVLLLLDDFLLKNLSKSIKSSIFYEL
jgi:hypothetical protein